MAPSKEASLFVDYIHSLFHHLSEQKSLLCYTVYLHDACRSFSKTHMRIYTPTRITAWTPTTASVSPDTVN